MKLLFKQADSCKTLRIIIRIGGSTTITDEEKALSKETGIAIYTIGDVIVSKNAVSVENGQYLLNQQILSRIVWHI